MPYTVEETFTILDNLEPNCTGIYASERGPLIFTVNEDNETCRFHGLRFDQNWPIRRHMLGFRSRMSEMKYPNGTLMHVTLTKEDRICRKIKRLWNQSNYVQKHPQFAY